MTTIRIGGALITLSDASPDEVAWTVSADHMGGDELGESFGIVADFVADVRLPHDLYHFDRLHELHVEIAKRVAPLIAAACCRSWGDVAPAGVQE